MPCLPCCVHVVDLHSRVVAIPQSTDELEDEKALENVDNFDRNLRAFRMTRVHKYVYGLLV